MRKLGILLLVGLILASVLLTGISQAGDDKSKEKSDKGKGQQLTPADKRSQVISVLIILVVIALTW